MSLVGRQDGAVKALSGFKKAHHTVPDAVNAATTAFFARLCADEVAAEGEKFFQRAKAALNYKRAQIALEVASPTATLVARDFTLELVYALEAADPARYQVTSTLHSLRNAEVVELPEFDAIFAGQFDAVMFEFKKGVRVEAVIDAVENLEDAAEPGLRVDYPSDYRSCTLTVAGVEAEVICDGVSLEMRFARKGSPRELVAAFAEMKRVFSLAKHKALAGLLS